MTDLSSVPRAAWESEPSERYGWYELQPLASKVRWIVAGWSLFSLALAVLLLLGWKLQSDALLGIVVAVAEPPGLIVLGALGIVCGIVYLVWVYRASANLYALPDSGERMRPGWAVGGYFIPFANLVMPYLGMRNLTAPVNGGAGVWWAFVLIGEGCQRVGDRIATRATSMSAIEWALGLLILGCVLQAYAGWRLYKIVAEVTVWQTEERRRFVDRQTKPAVASPLIRM